MGGWGGCLAVVSCHAGARVKFYINHAISRQEKKRRRAGGRRREASDFGLGLQAACALVKSLLEEVQNTTQPHTSNVTLWGLY